MEMSRFAGVLPSLIDISYSAICNPSSPFCVLPSLFRNPLLRHLVFQAFHLTSFQASDITSFQASAIPHLLSVFYHFSFDIPHSSHVLSLTSFL